MNPQQANLQEARNQRCQAILTRMQGWENEYKDKGSNTFRGSVKSASELAQEVRKGVVAQMPQTQTQNQIMFTAQDETRLNVAQLSFRNAIDSAVNFPQGKADKDMLPQLKETVKQLNGLVGTDKQEPIKINESAISKLMGSLKAKIGSNNSNNGNGPSTTSRNV